MTRMAVSAIARVISESRAGELRAILMKTAQETFEPIVAKLADAAAVQGLGLTALSEMRKELAIPAIGALLQHALQSVAASQPTRAECPQCGQLAKSPRLRPRTIDTLHGPLTLLRRYFHCHSCRVGFSPFDDAIGLSSGRKQEDVQKNALALASEVPFATASQLYEQLTGLTFSDHTMHDLVAAKGGQATVSQILPDKKAVAGLMAQHTVPGAWRPILVIAADGAHLPIRSEEQMGRAESRGT